LTKFALALWLLLCCGGLFAINIGQIAFEADFPVDSGELLVASELQAGAAYQPEEVQLAIARLLSHFRDQNRFYVSIPLPELLPLPDGSLKLLFRIAQIADSSQIQVRYSGLRYFSESKLHEFAFTSPDRLYPLGELDDIMNRVMRVYHQRGYLFVSVGLDSLLLDEPLIAWISVEEGNPQRISGYRFLGNNVSRDSYLLKSSGLSRQRVITPQVLKQAEENLMAKDYIRSARVLPLDEENLLFEIQEGRMTYLEGLLGIGEEGGKRQLSGMVNLEFLNLWGTDRGIRLFWRKSPSDYSELRFRYHESGVSHLPFAADLALSRTMQDSLWIRSIVDADIYYLSLYQQIGISIASSSILPGNSGSAIQAAKDLSIGGFWRYSSTRGGRIPILGTELEAEYNYIPGKTKGYGSLKSRIGRYQPLQGNLLAFIGAHYMNNENQHPAPYDLFTMGGYASLRGYREDEYRSRRLGWTNLELRYMLAPETMLYGFYDHGFLLNAENDLSLNLVGIGAGLKLGTRLGILSIEYGLGYRDKSFSSFGLGMIHLGLDIAL
jgi:outer membrane protein assembly factor BamA